MNITQIQSWFRTRSAKIVIATSVILIAIAAAVGLVVFALWINSPDKKNYDAVTHGLSHPGSYNITSDDVDIDVVTRENLQSIDGTVQGLTFQFIIQQNTAYVRSDDPAKLYETFISGGVVAPSIIAGTLASLKDTWISLPLNEFTHSSPHSISPKCIADAKSFFAVNDTNAMRLASAYGAQRFMVIEPDNVNESTYRITIDKETLHAFAGNVQKTVLNPLDSCPDITEFIRAHKLDTVSAMVKLQDDAHILSSMSINVDDDTYRVTAEYDNVPTITVPTAATSYNEITSRLLRSLFVPGVTD